MVLPEIVTRPRTRWALATGLLLALVYLRTVSRDLGTIDSGELATVCARLGVAHPTGYPIYSLLGRVAVALYPGPPIVAVNLLSALIALAAALALAGVVVELTPLLSLPAWCPWAAALWIGCDRVFWDQATGNEVYGFHLLFVALLLRQGLRLLRPEAGPRELLLTAYLLGLAFANHLSSAFLLPALALALGFYLARPGAWGRGGPASSRLLLACVGLAALAWTAEFVLVVRSLHGPILNWGAVHVWDRFWRHTMAEQYRVWMFESGSAWAGSLATYLRALPGRIWWPLLVLVLPGAWSLGRASGRRLLFLGTVALVTMAWAASYDIHDIETYFLPADLVFCLLASLGLAETARWTAGRLQGRRATRVALMAGALAGVLAAIQCGLHFRENDHRDDHFIRAHAETLLRSLPPRTILLSAHWDALVSASFYLQNVEHLRPDVTVVDVELLRRSWDYPQLRRWDPTLLAPMEDRVARFLAQAKLFERKLPYDPGVIEKSYEDVIEGIAQLHRPQRPTAFTVDVQGKFFGRTTPLPEGLVYVLRDDPASSAPLAPPDVEQLLHAGFHPEDPIHRQVIEVWTQMLNSRIHYLEAYHRTAEIPAWQQALEKLAPLAARR